MDIQRLVLTFQPAEFSFKRRPTRESESLVQVLRFLHLYHVLLDQAPAVASFQLLPKDKKEESDAAVVQVSKPV